MTDALDAGDLAIAAARCADEKQGRNIVVLDVGDILAIAELFVVIDAPNRRLVRTLVDEIEQAVRELTGRSPLRVEGVREQQWVLMDYGDVVVHVFLDEIRRFYEIERLYRDVAQRRLGRRRLTTPVRGRLIARHRRYRCDPVRGCSSVGRALPWHGRGQGFDSPQLHSDDEPLGRAVADDQSAGFCGDTGTSRSASRPSRILLRPAW